MLADIAGLLLAVRQPSRQTVLMDVPDGTGALARVKERLLRFCRSAADTTGILFLSLLHLLEVGGSVSSEELVPLELIIWGYGQGLE